MAQATRHQERLNVVALPDGSVELFFLHNGIGQVNVPALQKIMVEFARENERSDLTGELIGDTLDDALADEGDAEAEDKIVSQVRRFRVVEVSLEYLPPY